MFGVGTAPVATGAGIVSVCAYKLEAETLEITAKMSESFRTTVLLQTCGLGLRVEALFEQERSRVNLLRGAVSGG